MSRLTQRFFLPTLWIVVFLHLLKDITQDLLGVKTPLDLLGNIQEDLSSFSLPQKVFVYILHAVALYLQLLILLIVPAYLKTGSKNHQIILLLSFSFLTLYLLFLVQLDPSLSAFHLDNLSLFR